MPITDCGYAMGRAIFSRADVARMRTSISDTLDRIARGFLTPFATSGPGLPLAERLERVAPKDRASASALFHGVCADAQHAPRLARLAHHPVLMARVKQLLAPRPVPGHLLRVRVAFFDPG